MKKILIVLSAFLLFSNNSYAMESDSLDMNAIRSNVVGFFVPNGSLAKDFKLAEGKHLSGYFNSLKVRMILFAGCLEEFDGCHPLCVDVKDSLVFTREIYETFKSFLQILFDNTNIEFEIVDFEYVKSIKFNLKENKIIFSDTFFV